MYLLIRLTINATLLFCSLIFGYIGGRIMILVFGWLHEPDVIVLAGAALWFIIGLCIFGIAILGLVCIYQFETGKIKIPGYDPNKA
jgi:hypothetical protein